MKSAELPEEDMRWHGRPRRHKPSSSKLDSITNGGEMDVTTRKTDLARADKPDTTMSPPGLSCKFQIKLLMSSRLSWDGEKFRYLNYSPNDCIQMNFTTQHQANSSPFCTLAAVSFASALTLSLLLLIVRWHQIEQLKIRDEWFLDNGSTRHAATRES